MPGSPDAEDEPPTQHWNCLKPAFFLAVSGNLLDNLRHRDNTQIRRIQSKCWWCTDNDRSRLGLNKEQRNIGCWMPLGRSRHRTCLHCSHWRCYHSILHHWVLCRMLFGEFLNLPPKHHWEERWSRTSLWISWKKAFGWELWLELSLVWGKLRYLLCLKWCREWGVTQIWAWDLPLRQHDPPARRTTRLNEVKIFRLSE